MRLQNLLEIFKFMCGIVLLSVPIVCLVISYIELKGTSVINSDHLSMIWQDGTMPGVRGLESSKGGGASNAPIFLGLSTLSGAYLLSNINFKIWK
jgi:hypothetical protein